MPHRMAASFRNVRNEFRSVWTDAGGVPPASSPVDAPISLAASGGADEIACSTAFQSATPPTNFQAAVTTLTTALQRTGSVRAPAIVRTKTARIHHRQAQRERVLCRSDFVV